MNTHANKSQESKSQSVANSISQKQSGGESIFQFVDNFHEAIQMRKLQEMANNSPQVQQLKNFQEKANKRPQAKQAAQLQVISDNYSARQQHLIQKKDNQTGLPENLKSGIENLSGYSMDDVKVHCNSPEPSQLQAHAFAQGTNIHLGTDQEKHLPHEAWHVVQQTQGRVKPTMQAKGVAINGDAGLEHEADVKSAKAMQMRRSKKDAFEFPFHTGTEPQDHLSQLKMLAQQSPDGQHLRQIRGLANGQPIQQTGNRNGQVVQRLITRDQWRRQTPWRAFKHRRAVARIDAPLHTYNNAQTINNLNALITEIRTYISGKEFTDPNNPRLTPARNLLTAALAERGNLLRPAYDIAHVGHGIHGPEFTSISQLPFVTSDAEMHTLATNAWGNQQLIAIGGVVGSHYSLANFQALLAGFPAFFQNNAGLVTNQAVPFIQALASLNVADTVQVWGHLFQGNPTRPRQIVQALAHDGMSAPQIRDFVGRMNGAGLNGNQIFTFVSEKRGHLNLGGVGSADARAVTEPGGLKVLSGPEIAEHFDEATAGHHDPSTHYPTGQDFRGSTISALWDDCNVNYKGKITYPGETSSQKRRRQKLALGEIISRQAAQRAIIQAIFGYKEGSQPRPFVSVANEDAYLAPNAHNVSRHTLGGAQMPNLDAVATRALTKVPGCGEVASIFSSVGSANSALSTLVNPYMTTNWRTIRERLTRGQNPVEAEDRGSVNGYSYRKSNPPHATAHAGPLGARPLRSDAPLDVNPVATGVVNPAWTYRVRLIGTRAVFRPSANGHGWGILTAYPITRYP
jgi:hypothetical protein